MKWSEYQICVSDTVAPLVGAWIEIFFLCLFLGWFGVAPLVGAWIEIKLIVPDAISLPVAPLVGAWIEISYFLCKSVTASVAPLVGAWIEILQCSHTLYVRGRRSSCRSVD